MPIRTILRWSILAAVLAAVVARVALERPASPALDLRSGVVLPQARPLPEFTLLDQHARPFTRARISGHWTLLFAGFTHCPDICPATLAMLARLETRMDEAGEHLQMVFLSLDPERDDPATLAPYLAHFHPGIVGLTGAPEEIDRLAQAIGLSHLRVDRGDDYTIDHSAALVLIDPGARAVAYFKPPLYPDALAADLGPVITRRH